VVHWRRGQLILEAYAGAAQIEATPLVLDVLDRFTGWEPFDAVARQFPKVPSELLRPLNRRARAARRSGDRQRNTSCDRQRKQRNDHRDESLGQLAIVEPRGQLLPPEHEGRRVHAAR